MNILITGGCGILGARLARTLLAAGKLALAGGPEQSGYLNENPQAVRLPLKG